MKKKQIVNLLITSALILSTSACAAKDINEEIPAENDDEGVLIEAMEQVIPSHSASAGKNETVYVLMNADGAQSSVIVSEQLKNKDGSSTIKDETELTDIVNVNGYGDYTSNADGTITWEADGSDIFYRGTTDKELPLSVGISYALDGKEVSASELAGKSGHVSITLSYENHLKQNVEVDGSEYEVYVPFMVVSGMILPNDHFTNVEAENAKVISEGNNNLIMGLAYPGLKESLGWDELVAKTDNEETKSRLKEISFPDHITVEADTTGFELGMTVTLASCDVFSQLDAGEGVDLSSVQDKLDELTDGSSKLADGSSELKKGTGELYDGTVTLKDGTAELLNGAGALYDGSAQLYDGTLSLKDGSAQLYDGTKQLKDGTAALSEGADSLCNGIQEYTNGAGRLYEGACRLSEGAAAAQSGAQQLRAGFMDNDVSGNAAKLAEGAAALSAGITQLNDTVSSKLTDSVSSMQQAVSLLDGAAGWMDAVMSAIDTYGAVPAENLMIPDAIADYSEALKALSGYSTEDCQAALAAYNTAHYKYVNNALTDASELSAALAKCSSITGQLSGESRIYQEMAGSMQELGSSLSGGIGQLKSGADQLSSGNSALAAGLKSIGEGVCSLDAGLAALSDGAKSLSDGAAVLNNNNGALNSGAQSLKDGANRLNSGASDLLNGMGSLKDGAAALSDGAGALKEGTGSLKDGAGRLDTGAGQLKDGASKLNEGAAELRDGLVKLDEEGVQKISRLLGENAADTINRIKAIRRAGEEYTSFTGAYNDGLENNSVRFIYKTDSVALK